MDGMEKLRPVRTTEEMPRKRAHLSVVNILYHRGVDMETTSPEPQRWGRWLETDEAPFLHPKFVVGEEWKPLPTGWLEQCSMMEVVNLEAWDGWGQPSDEQIQVVAEKVVEVGMLIDLSRFGPCVPMVVPVTPIPPGESRAWEPVDLKALRLRCRKGQARCRIYLVPK